MFLNEWTHDASLYFNRVPRDITNYTKRFFPQWTVGKCWYRQRLVSVGRGAILAVGVFRDNRYALLYQYSLVLPDKTIELDINYTDMLIDAKDTVWLMTGSFLLEIPVDEPMHETHWLDTSLWVVYGYAPCLPARIGVSARLMSWPNHLFAPPFWRLTKDDQTIQDFCCFPLDDCAFAVDAHDNILVRIENSLYYYDSEQNSWRHYFSGTTLYRNIAVDKNGSIICITGEDLLIIDTI